MKIYKRRIKIHSPRLDNEEEVVDLLRSGKWRIYSSPEGCAPGYSQLLLRRARGLGESGHALKLGVYPDEEIREIKERLRSKVKTHSKVESSPARELMVSLYLTSKNNIYSLKARAHANRSFKRAGEKDGIFRFLLISN